MRTAIITPFYRPSIGGVEHIVRYTARELARRGFEVHVVSTTRDNRWRRVSRPGTAVEDGGVIVHRLEPSALRVGYATLMKGLRKALEGIAPDVVHCHNLHPHLFQAIKWKRELGYKVVAQLHHPTATGIDSPLARLLYRYVMGKLVERQDSVDAFIAHTFTEKRWLSSEGVKPHKIHVLRYPCVPDELFEYKPGADIHDKLGAGTVIAYISRIHPRKGQHLLLQAAGYLKHWLKDFKVYIAGPVADERYLRKLRGLVEKRGPRESVAIDPGPLPEREKLDAISTSDVFACTPVKDIHPIVVLEALALGTPVAATGVGAVPEMLGAYTAACPAGAGAPRLPQEGKVAGKAVVLARPEPVEVSKAIIRALENRSEAGPDELAKVASAHRASSVVGKLVELYSSLTG